MRKGALLAGILLMLLAAGIIAAAIVPRKTDRLPVQAQRRLDQYLGAAFPGIEVAVLEVDRAAHPSRLTGDMAGPAFGDSVHFQTELGASHLDAGSLSPLPFPPADVWCVLLEGEAPPAAQVVLVVLHEDLYTADWIVYQGAGDAASVEARHLLSLLGCTLTPEPGDFDALDHV